MKVNTESLRLLGKELPWVVALIPERAEEFQVKLMDLDILSLRTYMELFYQPRRPANKVFLIDGSGQKIGVVGVKSAFKRVYKSFWPWRSSVEPTEVEFDESVEEAIKRIGDVVWSTRYIVEVPYESWSIRDVYIYKLPKRAENMRTWLDLKSVEASKNLAKVLEG